MDARVTKQRLSVLLSYDWLKILGVIAVTVAALIVFFTVISTRPTVAQKYEVYSYGGLIPAAESEELKDRLDERFSYDILSVSVETFNEGSMASQALTARRGVLEGSAVFVSAYSADENTLSAFDQICYMGVINRPEEGVIEDVGLFYNIETLMKDAESYLARFFGEEWETASSPDEGKVRESFLSRNGKDKRFKTEAQKEEGISLERERVLSIRKNYLAVREAFERGGLTVTRFKTERNPEGYPVGINLGRLSRLNDLFYYNNAEGKPSKDEVTLLLFNNGEEYEDAKYESFALISYLLEAYEPVYP